MRRQGGGHYGGDSGGGGGSGRGDGGGHHSYGGSAAQTHQQHPNSKSGYYQGRHHQEQQTLGEKEGGLQHNNQWRRERDGGQDKLPQTAMSPTVPFSEESQKGLGGVRFRFSLAPSGDESALRTTRLFEGREAPRSYYQNQRMPLERQGGGAQSHEEDMDIGYEDNNRVTQTFEGLEQRFLDDIMKLSREQTDAEDAENARHRERMNAINKQHDEQLFALRARHATRRDEFLRKESQARQQQYQQMVMEPYPTNNNTGPSDPRGYNPVDASAGEPHHGYNSESYDAYRERSQFPGNVRDHGYDSKVPYPKGRAYESGSRFY